MKENRFSRINNKKPCKWCVEGIITQTGILCRTCKGTGKIDVVSNLHIHYTTFKLGKK
jgi:hypothetical protein